MKRKRFRRGLSLIFLFVLIHLFFGLYAIYDNGYIKFGLTAIERYFIHAFTGEETRYTISGSPKHFLEDLCIRECDSCNLNCYPPENLMLNCNKECRLETLKGKTLLTEDQKTRVLVKKGLIIENPVFTCQNKCGFEEN